MGNYSRIQPVNPAQGQTYSLNMPIVNVEEINTNFASTFETVPSNVFLLTYLFENVDKCNNIALSTKRERAKPDSKTYLMKAVTQVVSQPLSMFGDSCVLMENWLAASILVPALLPILKHIYKLDYILVIQAF